MTFKNESKYYLCMRGHVKREAERHRSVFTRLRKELFHIVHSMGATQCHINNTMMLLSGIIFPGKPPDGWTKKDKNNCSRPENRDENKSLLRYFTPSRGYSINPHDELQTFISWLECPTGYRWTKHESSGYSRICSSFSDGHVFWFAPDGPIMLELPDVARARAAAMLAGEVVVDQTLDWKPPKGLKEISIKMWDLMTEQHEQRTTAA